MTRYFIHTLGGNYCARCQRYSVEQFHVLADTPEQAIEVAREKTHAVEIEVYESANEYFDAAPPVATWRRKAVRVLVAE